MSQTADGTETTESRGDSPSFPGSEKVYLELGDGIRVPARKITLSNGEPPLWVYDTSGPQGHDVRQGLVPLRDPWIRARGDVRGNPAGLPGFAAGVAAWANLRDGHAGPNVRIRHAGSHVRDWHAGSNVRIRHAGSNVRNWHAGSNLRNWHAGSHVRIRRTGSSPRGRRAG